MNDELILLHGGTRLGGDEPSGEYVPADLTFGTQWQQGFSTAECSLTRELAKRYADSDPFVPVRIVTKTGDTVWQGELRRPGGAQIEGPRQQLSPQAVGLHALREDRRDVRFLGIDRDLSRWRSPTLDRQIAVLTAGAGKIHQHSVDGAALKLPVPGYTWTSPAGRPFVEAVYDAAPMRVGRIGGTWRSAGSTDISGVPSWWRLITFAADDRAIVAGVAVAGNLITTGYTAADRTFDWQAAHAHVGVQLHGLHPGTFGNANESWEVAIRNLCVVGDHGLPLLGTGPADWAIRDSDALKWLIPRFGGGLTAGYMPDSPFGLPHLAALEASTLGAIANDWNGAFGFVSAVWEAGRWDRHPWGDGGRTWKVHIDDGVKLDQAGADGDAMWSGVVVTYREPDGTTRTVGPPGALADTTDERCRWHSDGPLSRYGRERIDHYDFGHICTADVAAGVAANYLAHVNAATRAGVATIVGDITDTATGERRASYWARAGDELIVTGVGDDAPHRIVETQRRGEAMTLTLDNATQSMDQMQALINTHLVGRL